MRPNVFITVRERGKIKKRRDIHNVWTDVGREYLRRLMSLESHNPDVPYEIGRPRHLQFGVGGKQQLTLPSAVDDAYPAGEDPHATDGKQYDHDFPVNPNIETLERPVRITGGDTPYPGDPGDVWLTTPTVPTFFIASPTPSSLALRYRADLAGGDLVYSPFTTLPISEAGIVVSSTADLAVPYNEVVAYVDFEPLELEASLELEVTWIISF